MTLSQKAALSLLIAVVLAAGFSMLAFTGFFNLVETRFYNTSITNSLAKEAEQDAAAVQRFLDEARIRFFDALSVDAVKRSFLPNQSDTDILERTRVYGTLLESQSGIQSVRFVDAGGMRIHFSTDSSDILSRSAETISYKNYDETVPFVSFSELAVSSGGNPKITLDGQHERLIFSFPFYDSVNVYRGTALYSLSVRAVAERLVAEGRLKIGENLSLVSNPPGMVSGLPGSLDAAEAIVPVISSIWRDGLLKLTALDSAASGSSFALISAKTPQGLFVGRIVDESLFVFPHSMKLILLAAMFLTVFLSIFLAFNLQPDTLTVVQNRLKNLQLSLIREYYERKGEMDWNHWYRELEQRREDVRVELKRGIKEKPALLEDIDSLIDKSWDEILTAIGGKRETRLAIDEDKLQAILSRMLAAAGTMPLVPGTFSSAVPAVTPPAGISALSSAEPAASGDDLTELSEVEELGELEELEEIPESEIEELGESEGTIVKFDADSNADDPEELEELEDAAPDQLEELDDAAADEVEELEALEELEELEELDETAGMELLKNPAEELPFDFTKSNIHLVFGEDDIPTIVERSGLELVEDLPEEIDEFGQLEELEEAESGGDSLDSGANVDVASQIEFNSFEKTNDEAEPADSSEFVIVSPFSGMFSKLGDDAVLQTAQDTDTAGNVVSGYLEEVNSGNSSLVYVPFQNEDTSEPAELPPEDDACIIKQKNGINYVDEKVKTPDSQTAKTLDPGLKNLVDSVIGKK